MNFLAHLYLSGESEELMIGNFIADSVTSKMARSYSTGIQKGIKLHHLIDEYTDSHAIVDKSKNRLRDKYGLYSGVIIDIFYDHYLSKNFHEYSSTHITDYAQRVYNTFDEEYDILPPKVKQLLPYMKKHNWLVNYGNIEGMTNVLYGMSRRASFDSKMDESIEELKTHYDAFGNEFKQFFPQLEQFVADRILIL